MYFRSCLATYAMVRHGPIVILLLFAAATIVGCGSSTQQVATTQAESRTDVAPAGSEATKKTESKSLDELFLFFPSKYPEGNWEPKGLAYEDVWFEAEDGRRLHGWFCPCDKPRAVLLYAHGNAGNLSYCSGLLQYLQRELRLSVLGFDYRGYGRSEGTATVEGVLQDARAARTWLARRARVDESEIVLMGRSLGGAVVVQLAAEKSARGLILESTFSSLRDAAAVHYPRLAWVVPTDRLNCVSAITRYKGPLLQSHGDADRTIPFKLGMKLFEAANEPKRFVTIAGGDHNDPQSTEYYRELDRFIGEIAGEVGQ